MTESKVEEPDSIARARPTHVDAEVVRSNFPSKLLSLRLTSFAGKGLPERMRTTAFAFLGLTAAASLALVAIFAQLSFPLLSPVPLPSDPSQENAVSEAVPVEGARSAPASGDRSRHLQVSEPAGVPSREGASGGGDAASGGSESVEAPAPGKSPGAAAPGGAGGGGQPGAVPGPAPAPAPESAPSPESAPVVEAPAQPPGPGRSSSSAAASNASPRGIEASSKQPSPAPAPSASTASAASGTSAQAVPHGKAEGQDK